KVGGDPNRPLHTLGPSDPGDVPLYLYSEQDFAGFFGKEVDGTAGDDVLKATVKAEKFDGGGGIDLVTLADAPFGSTANLADPGQNTGWAAGDTYNSIEGFIGTKFADLLIGDKFENIFKPGAGADKVDGGGGKDTVSYAGSKVGIVIDTTT